MEAGCEIESIEGKKARTQNLNGEKTAIPETCEYS